MLKKTKRKFAAFLFLMFACFGNAASANETNIYNLRSFKITSDLYRSLPSSTKRVWATSFDRLEEIVTLIYENRIYTTDFLRKYKVIKSYLDQNPDMDRIDDSELDAIDHFITDLVVQIIYDRYSSELVFPVFKRKLYLASSKTRIKYVWDQKVDNSSLYKLFQKVIKEPDSLSYLYPEPKNEGNLIKSDALLDQYAYYSDIVDNGGFVDIPKSVLRKTMGETGDDILALKTRLFQSGDFTHAPMDATYTPELSSALKVYQKRMGIPQTGKIDNKTYEELQVSAEDRLHTISVNIDRFIWDSYQKKEMFYLEINIPEYKMHVYLNDSDIGSHKVIVGKKKNPTPVLNSKISYYVENPLWNIPNSIVKNEMLQHLTENPYYVEDRNISIYNKEGQEIDPGEVDWSDFLDQKRVPYRFVKKQGKTNPLGKIKFIFPNKYAVYLHDTSNRALFGRSKRSLSHGCVRLEHPEFLRELVSKSFGIRSKVETKNGEKYFYLKKRIPVDIRYKTAWVDKDGYLNFRKDIYNYDKMHFSAKEEILSKLSEKSKKEMFN